MNFFSYLSWHFSIAPTRIIRYIRNLAIFCEYFFSIKILLSTLFAPWKRQTFQSKAAFSLSNYFETVVSNLLSRILGSFVRSIVIIIGIISQILILIFGLIFLIIFIFLPIITLPIYYKVYIKKKEKEQRTKLLTILSSKEFPNISAIELKNWQKTSSGSFLTSRLLISKNDIGSLDLNQILQKYPIKPQDVIEVARWYNHAKDDEDEYSNSFELANLLRISPLGRDWQYGYTLNLNRFTLDLIYEAYSLPHLVGRRAEIERIQRILAASGRHNVTLVGEPGSGRHAIVLAFALDVFEQKVLPPLRSKKVLDLNLNLVISEAKNESAVKGIVDQILKEAVSAGNIILVIDHFEQFVGGGDINLSEVFSQVFAREDIQVIGITTNEGFHKTIVNNGTINKIFETVEIPEISKEDTLKILEHLTPHLELKYKIFIPFTSLTRIIDKGDLITAIPNPEKSIDILREVSLYCSSKEESSSGRKILSPSLVDIIISQKSKTPQGVLGGEEKQKLANIEKLLHEHVIDQEQAIEEIGKSLRRSRLDISAKGKPIGTFLFLGPTGVGKTETAKSLSRVYFGSEKTMIRLDMSQYQGTDSVNKLLGNAQNNDSGVLIKLVRDNPFSVLLLDEIEKASQEVLNLFLTILDEGYITDSFAKKVSFEHTIIIGTSNAGSEYIRQRINEGIEAHNLSKELTEYVLNQKIFTPEFINRFDAVVVYRPLTEEHLKMIARLMLEKLNKRLEPKKISVNISQTLIDKIAKEGFDPQFGARPMKRVIQEKIEDYIAKRLLNEEIKEGNIVTIHD